MDETFSLRMSCLSHFFKKEVIFSVDEPTVERLVGTKGTKSR